MGITEALKMIEQPDTIFKHQSEQLFANLYISKMPM